MAEDMSGAIENGRVCIDRLDFQHRFSCEGGDLSHCQEWLWLKEAFNALCDFVVQAPSPDGDVRAVAKKLLMQWKAYQASAGSHEEAYYKLAKYAYNHWIELEKIMEKENV